MNIAQLHEVIATGVLGFLGIRCLNMALNYFQDPRIKPAELNAKANVSVLIPARNEEANLESTLKAWEAISQEFDELIVLDDGSEDQTQSVVKRWQSSFPKLKLIEGKTLPKGWLGKNYACHQLAQHAKGDYFLFVDADVLPKRGLVASTVVELETKKLSLLSIFPDQLLESTGEKIVVPLMHYLLLSLLPLSFIYKFKFTSMAAANGQFMLFKAEAYRRFQWHEIVKNHVAEDIQTVREIKKRGMRAATYLGGGLVWCRMYPSYNEAISGFSKNFLAGFGNVIGVLFYLFMLSLGWAFVAIHNIWWLLGGISLVVLTNLMLAQLSNQSFFMLLWTHPLRIFATLQVGINSILRKLKKQNQWKGRNVYSPTP